jgi:DNA polymerase-1
VELKLELAQHVIGMGGGKARPAKFRADGSRKIHRYNAKGDVDLTQVFHMQQRDATRALAEMEIACDRIAEGDEPDRYNYACIPPDDLGIYNAIDTISTDRLKIHYDEASAKDPRPQRVWDVVANDMTHALTIMENNGVCVSRERIAALQNDCILKIADLEQKLSAWGTEINWNSGDQVADLFFNQLRLPIKSLTPTGKPQLTAEILRDLDHPAAAALVEWRQATKFKSQYADGMASFIRDDGRIHPTINVVGTVTGRPSCQGPNLMNIPRANSLAGKLCRDIFVAPHGYTLVEVDQSQIELRVAAMLSGDPIMIDLFVRDVDFHLATAIMIAPLLGIDPAVLHKDHPLRDQAKIVNFATLYGDPPQGLAFKLGISVRRAVELQAAILGKFKKLKAWIEKCVHDSRRNGICWTWWAGMPDFRQRKLWAIMDANDEARKTAERSSYNTPVQGTAAEYTNASLWPIQQWIENEGVDAKMVLTVYDSILLEVADHEVPRVASNVRRIVESHESMGVPLKGDVKVGKAWGSLEKYKEAA